MEDHSWVSHGVTWDHAVRIRTVGQALFPCDDIGDQEDGQADGGGRNGVDTDGSAEDPQTDGQGEGTYRGGRQQRKA